MLHSGFTCPSVDDGLYQNIHNFFTFWYCANGTATLMSCPSNLVFFERFGRCDYGGESWRSNVKSLCHGKKSRLFSVPYPDPCQGGLSTYPVPVWVGRASYIKCNQTTRRMESINTCPQGTIWLKVWQRCGTCTEALMQGNPAHLIDLGPTIGWRTDWSEPCSFLWNKGKKSRWFVHWWNQYRWTTCCPSWQSRWWWARQQWIQIRVTKRDWTRVYSLFSLSFFTFCMCENRSKASFN